MIEKLFDLQSLRPFWNIATITNFFYKIKDIRKDLIADPSEIKPKLVILFSKIIRRTIWDYIKNF
jgi:hypothetical protein